MSANAHRPQETEDAGGKIIRDIVFGYVPITALDRTLIDTPIFQRLKRIRQLTAFSLYPSANHTRFEHSLGVMYIGSSVFRSLYARGDLDWAIKKADISHPQLDMTVRYACLLHDVGHAPFSHVGEAFYDASDIWVQVCAVNPQLAHALGPECPETGKHELMSCLVALKHYARELSAKVDLELLCRMICGVRYQPAQERSVLNPVIEILNSTYDVDRLDYVLRDSTTTGTFGVSIDYERLIRGYAVREKTLLFLRRSLPSVVNLITGRDFLYQWLYNHHTVAYSDLLVERTLAGAFAQKDATCADLFSLGAIESGADDCTLWEVLKRQYNAGDRYAKPLFERKFHKALWKTPYDFVAGRLSTPVRIRLWDQAKVGGQQPGDISELEKLLCEHCGVEEGTILVANRIVKHFNPTTNRQVCFWIKDTAKEYGEVCGGSPFAGGPTDYPLIFYDADAVERETLLKTIREVV